MENQVIKQPQSTPRKRFWFWVGKIKTKEESLKIIKSSSYGFYALAILDIVAYFFLHILSAIIIDVAILTILAFLLRKFNSTVVAIILLLWSILIVVSTGINEFGGGYGGTNIVLAIMAVWMSIRAIQATTMFHKLEK